MSHLQIQFHLILNIYNSFAPCVLLSVPEAGIVGDVMFPADQRGGEAMPCVAAEGDVVTLHHLDPGLCVRVPEVPRLDADPGVWDDSHIHRHKLLHAVKVLVVIDQTHPLTMIFAGHLKNENVKQFCKGLFAIIIPFSPTA